MNAYTCYNGQLAEARMAPTTNTVTALVEATLWHEDGTDSVHTLTVTAESLDFFDLLEAVQTGAYTTTSDFAQYYPGVELGDLELVDGPL